MKKFGEGFMARIPQMLAQFESYGCPMTSDFNTAEYSGTMDSHRLLHHALTLGGERMQNDVIESLFDQYFHLGYALSRKEVLYKAAEAGGMPKDQAAAVIENPTLHRAEVAAAASSMSQRGVSGVPHISIGKHAVSGAQPPEQILKMLMAAAQ